MPRTGSARLLCVLIVFGVATPTRCDSSDTGYEYQTSEAEVVRALSIPSTPIKGRPLNTVEVKLGFNLIGVTELNADRGYMETTGWLTMNWNDSRLIFSPVYQEISDVRVHPSDIWTPDITLYNAVSTGVKVLNENDKAVVSGDGSVFLVQQLTIRSQCDVKGHLSAGDAVSCTLKFGSWTHNGHLIDLKLSEPSGGHSILNEFSVTGQWTVTEAVARRKVLYYACCPEPFPDVTFTLTLQERRSSSGWSSLWN